VPFYIILRSSTILILQSFNYSFSKVSATAAQLKFLHAPPAPHSPNQSNILQLLGRQNLANPAANRRYLLDKTQHLIGGFGKKEGNPPDIYHAYLGLASLSLMGEEGLKPIDATACFSIEAWEWIEGLPWNGGEVGGRKEKRPVLEDNSYIGMTGG
jgi:hypothetical protein